MAIITVTSYTCDACGKRALEKDTEGWYYLSLMHKPSMVLLSMPPQRPPDTWQVCSTECMAKMAAQLGRDKRPA